VTTIIFSIRSVKNYTSIHIIKTKNAHFSTFEIITRSIFTATHTGFIRKIPHRITQYHWKINFPTNHNDIITLVMHQSAFWEGGLHFYHTSSTSSSSLNSSRGFGFIVFSLAMSLSKNTSIVQSSKILTFLSSLGIFLR